MLPPRWGEDSTRTSICFPTAKHALASPFPSTSAPLSDAPPPPPAPPPVLPPDLLDAEDGDLQSVEAPLWPIPAPLRPPNSKLLRLHEAMHAVKLVGELASLLQAMVMVIDAGHLRGHRADLLAGAPTLRDEIPCLEAVRNVCSRRVPPDTGRGSRHCEGAAS